MVKLQGVRVISIIYKRVKTEVNGKITRSKRYINMGWGLVNGPVVV